jgi:soluble lytic murein transglycosylase-like protein
VSKRAAISMDCPSWEVPGLVRGRRAVAAIVAATLTCTVCAGPAALAATLQDYQAQEQAVAAQLPRAQQAYTAALNAWSAALQRLDKANAAMHQAAENLDAVTLRLHAAQAELQQRQAAVAAQQKVVAQDKQQADQGLVTIQQYGSVSFLSVLMGARSFGDFLTRLTLLQTIWGMEVGHLRQARTDEAQLMQLEQQQQQTVEQVSSLQGQAQATLQQLTVQTSAAQQAQNDASVAMHQADAAVEQLITERNGLQAQIQKLIQELDSGNIPWSQVLADIRQLAAQYGIDPALVEAVVLQESGGQSAVKSSAGAIGLMQLMPRTAAALGVNPYDPVQNLEGGITYLLEMLKEFNGNVALALEAYNAGPYAVKEYGGAVPYTETQNYVNDVLALYREGK